MGLDMYLGLKQYKEGRTFEQHKKLLDLFWDYIEELEDRDYFKNELVDSNFYALPNEKIVLLVLTNGEYKDNLDSEGYNIVTYKGVKRRQLNLYREGEISPDEIDIYKSANLITLTDTKEIDELFYNRAKEILEHCESKLELIRKEFTTLESIPEYKLFLELIKKVEDGSISCTEASETIDQLFVEREYDEFMYWSKANHIHNWMVQNIQNGEDDCREHHLSWEKSEKLIQDIKAVLADNNLAEKLLPRTSGFFFGSDEYNERYYFELERTLERLETAREYKEEGYEMFYDSSW